MIDPFSKNLSWIETEFVEIKNSSTVFLDLRYATPDNFVGQNLYGGFHRCFLHPMAADKFARACRRLEREKPGYKFRIWDALRPRSVQRQMFDHVIGTPYQDYVAPPHPGSWHNFGLALDLTLQDASGRPLDMGSDFDDFHDRAQPILEEKFLAAGELSREAYTNRLLLRDLMQAEGFQVLDHEWWHFNATTDEDARHQFACLE